MCLLFRLDSDNPTITRKTKICTTAKKLKQQSVKLESGNLLVRECSQEDGESMKNRELENATQHERDRDTERARERRDDNEGGRRA
jgi:hypothetical protein